jgi:hypothetical protein
VAHLLHTYGYRMHAWRGGAWTLVEPVRPGTRNYLFSVRGSRAARAGA